MCMFPFLDLCIVGCLVREASASPSSTSRQRKMRHSNKLYETKDAARLAISNKIYAMRGAEVNVWETGSISVS